MGSYYDVDAILTDAHKVPCTFEIDIPGLGYLDENPGGDVNSSSSLTLQKSLSLSSLRSMRLRKILQMNAYNRYPRSKQITRFHSLFGYQLFLLSNALDLRQNHYALLTFQRAYPHASSMR